MLANPAASLCRGRTGATLVHKNIEAADPLGLGQSLVAYPNGILGRRVADVAHVDQVALPAEVIGPLRILLACRHVRNHFLSDKELSRSGEQCSVAWHPIAEFPVGANSASAGAAKNVPPGVVTLCQRDGDAVWSSVQPGGQNASGEKTPQILRPDGESRKFLHPEKGNQPLQLGW